MYCDYPWVFSFLFSSLSWWLVKIELKYMSGIGKGKAWQMRPAKKQPFLESLSLLLT